MRNAIIEWQANGVCVALIGNGNAAFAEAFREDFALAGPIFIDPDLVAYRAAGLRRNAAGIANPRFLGNSFRALRSGARQRGVQGDPWQLGGTFVFAAGGALRLAERAAAAGDEVRAATIDAALADEAPLLGEDSARPSRLVAALARSSRLWLDASPLGSFDRTGFARHAAAFDPDDLAVDLSGRRCLITGANSGIGFATALALADLGGEVVLLCRNAERGRAALAQIRSRSGNQRVSLVTLDVSDLASIDRALPELAATPVDVLVHNAGVLPDARSESPQGLELCFATHIAGPQRLTAGLREALRDAGGARVIWVSSGGMLTRRLDLRDTQWTRRGYDGTLAYAETKRAQVVLSELWASAFADSDVSVNSMHPGWADTPAVASSLPRFHRITEAILRTPEEGADTVVWLAASAAAAELNGAFVFDRQAVRTHWLPQTRESTADRAALWELVTRFEPKTVSNR